MKLLLLFFISFAGYGETKEFYSKEGRHFVELYQQDGQWLVDEYLVKPGQLQNHEKHLVFDLENKAQIFIQELQKKQISNISSIALIDSEKRSTPLWTATETWNDSWEEKYAQWIEKNFNEEFFVTYKVKTDCADVAYALRWIFSRIHKLPIGATLAGTGVVFNHESGKAEWSHLPTHIDWEKDTRFLTALNWILDNVYTKTLFKDAYPLEITPQTIHPGTILFHGGHTEVIQYIKNDGSIPIKLLSSTVPREIRTLFPRYFTDATPINADVGGLYQFRYLEQINAKWVLREKINMSHYSLEQYKEGLCEDTPIFALCVYKKLHLEFDPQKALEGILTSLKALIEQRLQIVKEGYEVCLNNDCSPGTILYEDWSTPSRDKRLYKTYDDSSVTVSNLTSFDPELFNKWTEALKKYIISDSLGQFNLSEFFTRLNLNLVSSDPRDPIDTRWASSTQAIAKYVSNRYQLFEKDRQALIHSANQCREDRSSCEINSEEFKKLNTIDMDYQTRNLIYTYQIFCETEKNCPAISYDHIWFRSSLPWDSVTTREGKNNHVHKPILFFTSNKLIEIGDFIIVDSNKLFQISTQKYILAPEGSYLAKHPAKDEIFAIKANTFYKWNGSSFDHFYTVTIPPGISSVYPMFLGKNHLFIEIYRENSSDNRIEIIDLRNFQLKASYPYTNLSITTASFDSSLYVLSYTDKDTSTLMGEDEGEFIEFKTPIKIYSLLKKDHHKWLGIRHNSENYSNDLISFDQNSFEYILKNIKTQSYANFSNLWFFTGTELLEIYDSNFKLIDKFHNESVSIWENSHLTYAGFGTPTDQHFWVNKDEDIFKLNPPENLIVQQIANDWVSVLDSHSSTYYLIDYQFNKISNDNEFSKICTKTYYNYDCVTDDANYYLKSYAVYGEEKTFKWFVHNLKMLDSNGQNISSVQVIEANTNVNTRNVTMGNNSRNKDKKTKSITVNLFPGVQAYYPVETQK